MRRSPFLAVAAILAAGLAGCAGTRTEMISEVRAPVAEVDVKLYHQRPPGAVEIAWLESKSAMGFGTQGQHDAAVARLRREAGKLGANGVVVLGRGRGDSPVGIGVGVGSWGSHGGASVGGGIPTTQEYVSGIAVWVPPNSVAPGGPYVLPADPPPSESPPVD